MTGVYVTLKQREADKRKRNCLGREEYVQVDQAVVLGGLLRHTQHLGKCRPHWFASTPAHAEIYQALQAGGGDDLKAMAARLGDKARRWARALYRIGVTETELLARIQELENDVRAWAENVRDGGA